MIGTVRFFNVVACWSDDHREIVACKTSREDAEQFVKDWPKHDKRWPWHDFEIEESESRGILTSLEMEPEDIAT